MESSVIDALIGSGAERGLLDKLGTVGDKLNSSSRAWSGLIGPYQAKTAPPPPGGPRPALNGTLPDSAGILSSVSGILSSTAFGIVALGVVLYLFVRGE